MCSITRLLRQMLRLSIRIKPRKYLLAGVDVDLTGEQWEVLEPLIPKPPRRVDGRGRPWRHPREVLDGILWVLRTGAP